VEISQNLNKTKKYIEPKTECSLFLNYQEGEDQKYGISPATKYYGFKTASSSEMDQNM